MLLQDLPIKRKLMLVTLLTSSFALFLMCAALLSLELMTFRRDLVANTGVLAKIVGLNSTAALAFANEQDADEVLAALAVEQQVVAAAIYDKTGDLFSSYRSPGALHTVPPHPGQDGHSFSQSHLLVFQPIVQNGKRLGTVYLLTDLERMHSRFWIYGGLIAVVSVCSALGALALASSLQKRISTPILELAEVARVVSENEDYSVRAAKYGSDELGSLTDAFNTMLAKVGENRNALAASEERLRLALEGSKTGTWDWNLVTGEIIWDHYMYPLFGHSEEEFAGTMESVIEAIHPDDRAELERQMWGAIQNKTDLNLTFRAIAEDGTVRHMASRGRAFYATDGTPIRMSGVSMDITESKRTEEALQAAKEAAEAANQAKDNFLAILSHELRTPLTPVLATLAMTEEDSSVPAHIQRELRMIRRNVDLEARLIDDLLDVTRISRGKLELNRQVVDARSLLEHAMQNYCAPEATKKNLNVTIDAEATETFVLADTSRLTQVFWNLLQNACKFTPRGGFIHVKLSNESNGDSSRPDLVIEVADNGIGIDPSVLPRIFDAFEQGERSRSRLFGGLGLGLAISRALVELHGGTISATSEGKEKGSKFTIRLHTEPQPARNAAPALPERGPSSARADGQRPLRILLVEDHSDTAVQLSRLLKKAGHQVTWASTIQEARTIAAGAGSSRDGASFDLLISDLGLPDGSGHDLMRELSATHHFPGIALSGYGLETDVQESLAAGFSCHLTKPIDWTELKHAIRNFSEVATLKE